MITNLIISLIVTTILYLVAIRYLQNYCPISKFFKFIIYICLSTITTPAINYIHPANNNLSKYISDEENSFNNDWQQAQQKAQPLTSGLSSQTQEQESNQPAVIHGKGYNPNADYGTTEHVMIGRDGKVIDEYTTN